MKRAQPARRPKFIMGSDCTAPKHLMGAMVRAHQKAVRASSRMHHGRKHRVEKMTHVATGRRFTIGKTRWTTAHGRWQARFQAACDRLRPYNCWAPVKELAP